MKLERQYFDHLLQRVDSVEKILNLGKIESRRRRGWGGWMVPLAQWTWIWLNSGSWWWTGRPGVLLYMGSQKVGQDWATELNWTEQYNLCSILFHIRRRYLPYSFPTQYMYLILSANDLQDPYPFPCTGYKNGPRTHVQHRVAQCWLIVTFRNLACLRPANLPSPTPINCILLSFYLVYGNSFLICAQTMTEMSGTYTKWL